MSILKLSDEFKFIYLAVLWTGLETIDSCLRTKVSGLSIDPLELF